MCEAESIVKMSKRRLSRVTRGMRCTRLVTLHTILQYLDVKNDTQSFCSRLENSVSLTYTLDYIDRVAFYINVYIILPDALPLLQ